VNIAHIRTIRHIAYTMHTYMTECYISPMETRLTLTVQFKVQDDKLGSSLCGGRDMQPMCCDSLVVVSVWSWGLGMLGSRIVSPIVCFVRGVDLIDPHSVLELR